MADINTGTHISNWSATQQVTDGVKLLTDERGHYYLLAQIIEGNTLGDSFKVTALNPTPQMSVSIQRGTCLIPIDDYAYVGWADANMTLPIAESDQALSRISYIVAYVKQDTQYAQTVANNPGLLHIAEVQGTEAASNPKPPTSEQIRQQIGAANPYIILASISVKANSSAIRSADITDERIGMKIKDGIGLPHPAIADALYQGSTNPSNRPPLQWVVIQSGTPIPPAVSGYDLCVLELV